MTSNVRKVGISFVISHRLSVIRGKTDIIVWEKKEWPVGNRPCFKGSGYYRAPVMQSTFTALVKHTGERWIEWIQEAPGVNAQERTREEPLVSLREVLGKALEFDRQEARQAAENDFSEELVGAGSAGR